MTDAISEIAEMALERLMATTGSEPFRRGVEMFETARRMVIASLPSDLTEADLKRRLFERVYGILCRSAS